MYIHMYILYRHVSFRALGLKFMSIYSKSRSVEDVATGFEDLIELQVVAVCSAYIWFDY